MLPGILRCLMMEFTPCDWTEAWSLGLNASAAHVFMQNRRRGAWREAWWGILLDRSFIDRYWCGAGPPPKGPQPIHFASFVPTIFFSFLHNLQLQVFVLPWLLFENPKGRDPDKCPSDVLTPDSLDYLRAFRPAPVVRCRRRPLRTSRRERPFQLVSPHSLLCLSTLPLYDEFLCRPSLTYTW